MHYHPFLPRRWTSAGFLKWLKRVHAWTGFWGATCFLLLGTSGFLLNHRSQMKIDTGEPVEVSSVELPITPGEIGDADALERWAQSRLHLPVKAQPLGGSLNPPASSAKTFMGQPVAPAAKWVRVFNLTGARVTVSYVEGANIVSAKRDEVSALGVLKNLHKGTGLPIAWVLLLDTIAGALITMSLTGILLWSRLHGPRVLAGGVISGSVLWAIMAAGTSFS